MVHNEHTWKSSTSPKTNELPFSFTRPLWPRWTPSPLHYVLKVENLSYPPKPPTHVFMVIGSRQSWGVLLSPNSMSPPPEKSFWISKTNPCISPKEFHYFQKLPHPCSTLQRWSSITSKRVFFLLKVLQKSTLPYPLVNFPIKTSNFKIK